MGRLSRRLGWGITLTGALFASAACVALIDARFNALAVPSYIRYEKDEQPFQLDPNQPYKVSLVKFVYPFKRSGEFMITAEEILPYVERELPFQGARWPGYPLSREDRAKILRAIEDNRLLEMHKRYWDPATADGTHLELSIKQGSREKCVSFDNYVPRALARFLSDLDSILEEAESKPPLRVAQLAPYPLHTVR